jgi:hypothetical protein
MASILHQSMADEATRLDLALHMADVALAVQFLPHLGINQVGIQHGNSKNVSFFLIFANSYVSNYELLVAINLLSSVVAIFSIRVG